MVIKNVEVNNFFKRNILERAKDYPQFKQEFGHIEGDTIVSVHYKKCHHHDIAIYFSDPGTPSQRALNENSSGLFRKDGLPKEMDFNQVDQSVVSSVADKRNTISREMMNCQTRSEIF